MNSIKLSQIDNFQRTILYGSKQETANVERLLIDIYKGKRWRKSYINLANEFYLIEKDLTKDDIEEIAYCDSTKHRYEVPSCASPDECIYCGRNDLFIGYVIKGRNHDRYEPEILKQLRNKWADCVI